MSFAGLFNLGGDEVILAFVLVLLWVKRAAEVGERLWEVAGKEGL
jgi:hypothetical protein